jgi:transcriptional regulator with XRE-family HTH domain
MARHARRHSSRVFDGDGLAGAREARFWTQAELAEKVGVTARAVQRWEHGDSQPQFSAVRALADVLGMSPDRLYVAAPDPNGEGVAA